MENKTTIYHKPVLLRETISNLITDKNGIYVDCTLGGGGHTNEILKQLSQNGKVIAIDRDEDAIKFVKTEFVYWINKGQLIIVKSKFQNIVNVLNENNISKVNGVVADLGVSSFQIESSERGFSYLHQSELDMRMDKSQPINAKDIVNNYSQEKLVEIFFKYGEEPFSKRIARKIFETRSISKIEKVNDLISVIEKCYKGKHLIKCISRIFQAIRIEVNKELDELINLLEFSKNILLPKSRIAIISYHSLEDRIVKQFFVNNSKNYERSSHKLIPNKIIEPIFNLLTKKPIIPSEEEVKNNKRSRSAKLRIAEKN
ncbi:MAG: 16S rRNA (cytosine(1402)-N(4))-methyltransferase RsmH [Bacteroidetes bacterium]|nr:16S rRNA (cytosine(1402)-N(4))-methyltransferase RsmH [Bacteroidota bacterium]